ncbi:hypothetical protein F4820DRAFT_405136 [Hypoxylon rubiginosum]|uniref:Uncharacterized protein n=1 Tax=Hypoxylon rubiginosum TaxID=110542 RepID=A0ACB9ZH24_9PEZI|nr:hypothetical protein F4820DRAFT_405136 [Hypoxylon rubiginosum]
MVDGNTTMADGSTLDMKAFFPPGIDRDLNSLNFHLGNDIDNYVFTVENNSQFPKRASLLSLYDGGSVQGRLLGEIRKPIEMTERYEEIWIAVRNLITQRMTTVIMTRHTCLGLTFFRFKMHIGYGIETFEWRHSKGSEVHSIQPHPHADGYKLVRMRRCGPGGGLGGGRAERQHGEASDGKEIVAVWATMTRLGKKKPPFNFQLCGSGATDEMGGEFQPVALLTALKMYSTYNAYMTVPVPKKRRAGAAMANLAI